MCIIYDSQPWWGSGEGVVLSLLWLGSFPRQEITSPIYWLSCRGGCLFLWLWKLCHRYFKYQQGRSWWKGFKRASRGRQTRKKDLATHFQKNWHENPLNSSRALSDIVLEDERPAQKYQTEFCSAVHRVTRSQDRLHGTNNKWLISMLTFGQESLLTWRTLSILIFDKWGKLYITLLLFILLQTELITNKINIGVREQIL